MDQKTISIVSYITLIGWIIALVTYNGNTVERSSLARFHLRQSFGIIITGFVLYFAVMVLGFIIPFFFFLNIFVWIAMLVLWIMGLIGAINAQENPVPVLGEFYQRTFTFIN